ncbi:MAG: hypothetical protein KBB71_11715 [Lentimicrobiaceae bacterium]|nr:hypothetical protein [Lentimicrobiaceae bacterium]
MAVIMTCLVEMMGMVLVLILPVWLVVLMHMLVGMDMFHVPMMVYVAMGVCMLMMSRITGSAHADRLIGLAAATGIAHSYFFAKIAFCIIR